MREMIFYELYYIKIDKTEYDVYFLNNQTNKLTCAGKLIKSENNFLFQKQTGISLFKLELLELLKLIEHLEEEKEK